MLARGIKMMYYLFVYFFLSLCHKNMFRMLSCGYFLCINSLLIKVVSSISWFAAFILIVLAPCCENIVWSAAGSPGELPLGWRPVLSQCNPKAGRSTSASTAPDQCNWCLPGYCRKEYHSAVSAFILQTFKYCAFTYLQCILVKYNIHGVVFTGVITVSDHYYFGIFWSHYSILKHNTAISKIL